MHAKGAAALLLQQLSSPGDPRYPRSSKKEPRTSTFSTTRSVTRTPRRWLLSSSQSCSPSIRSIGGAPSRVASLRAPGVNAPVVISRPRSRRAPNRGHGRSPIDGLNGCSTGRCARLGLPLRCRTPHAPPQDRNCARSLRPGGRHGTRPGFGRGDDQPGSPDLLECRHRALLYYRHPNGLQWGCSPVAANPRFGEDRHGGPEAPRARLRRLRIWRHPGRPSRRLRAATRRQPDPRHCSRTQLGLRSGADEAGW